MAFAQLLATAGAAVVGAALSIWEGRREPELRGLMWTVLSVLAARALQIWSNMHSSIADLWREMVTMQYDRLKSSQVGLG